MVVRFNISLKLTREGSRYWKTFGLLALSPTLFKEYGKQGERRLYLSYKVFLWKYI